MLISFLWITGRCYYGCPAHDQRDLDFANKYNLEILQVIEPGNGLILRMQSLMMVL